MCKKPSPGITKRDGPEIPQMADTRRGGSFVSPFFCLKNLLSAEWSLTYCYHDGEAGGQLSEDEAPAAPEGTWNVCSRSGHISRGAHTRVPCTLRCYFSLQSSSTDLRHKAILNYVFLPRKCP